MALKRVPFCVAAVLLPAIVIGGAGILEAAGDRAGRGAPQLPPGFEVGQYFPEIALPSAEDGNPLSLARFRGKKTILHIFASW